MNNGTMKLISDKIHGELRTYALCLNFWLEKNQSVFSDKSPGFIAMTKAPSGHVVQIGVAWEQTIKRGRMVGASMYQITIDDPAFGEHPLHFSAFPNESVPNCWNVQIERKRQEGVSSSQNVTNSQAQSDEIPGFGAAA